MSNIKSSILKKFSNLGRDRDLQSENLSLIIQNFLVRGHIDHLLNLDTILLQKNTLKNMKELIKKGIEN